MKKETLISVYLNSRSKMIKHLPVSIGNGNSASVCSKEILRHALSLSAVALILVHNHPSGDITPSKNDIHSTRSIIDAGKVLGIDVLDHIIIGQDGYTSMMESGLL
jgi:DNA repair protein RadC